MNWSNAIGTSISYLLNSGIELGLEFRN